jgi:tRNA G18 (ribose-2'-O)-methylase SpoU
MSNDATSDVGAPWRPVPIDDARLAGLRGLRDRPSSPQIIIEGELALRRALEAGHRPQLVVATPACARRLGAIAATGLAAVLDAVQLGALVGHEFHRGCLAVVARPTAGPEAWRDTIAALASRPHARIVALDRIADAENVGAVIRTARALAIDLVVLGRGCADPYSRRAVRTSMGHALAQPLVTDVELAAMLAACTAEFPALAWWCTGSVGPATALRPWARPDGLPQHLGIVLGNEGDGVADAVAALCGRRVAIATAGAAESLNVAAAAAIVLWSLAPAG